VDDIADWKFRVKARSLLRMEKKMIARVYQQRLDEIVRSGEVPKSFFGH
tara:strand:+ start:6582 stop:6728 length:147 start_codon:yes stop_codon:yes gene_type:complete